MLNYIVLCNDFFIDCFIEDQNIVYTFGFITIIKFVNYLGIL